MNEEIEEMDVEVHDNNRFALLELRELALEMKLLQDVENACVQMFYGRKPIKPIQKIQKMQWITVDGRRSRGCRGRGGRG